MPTVVCNRLQKQFCISRKARLVLMTESRQLQQLRVVADGCSLKRMGNRVQGWFVRTAYWCLDIPPGNFVGKPTPGRPTFGLDWLVYRGGSLPAHTALASAHLLCLKAKGAEEATTVCVRSLEIRCLFLRLPVLLGFNIESYKMKQDWLIKLGRFCIFKTLMNQWLSQQVLISSTFLSLISVYRGLRRMLLSLAVRF